MGRSLTNNLSLSVAVESALGIQPTSGWKIVEPTTIGKFGPSLTKLTRTPISKNRQRRKGALTDLNSSVEFEADITYNHLMMFAEGLLFATARGGTVYDVSGVTATGFTVAAVMLFAPIYLGIWRRPWQVAGALAAVGVLLGLALIYTPYVVGLLAPGLSDDPTRYDLAVTLTRITFPSLLLVSMQTMISGELPTSVPRGVRR